MPYKLLVRDAIFTNRLVKFQLDFHRHHNVRHTINDGNYNILNCIYKVDVLN